MSSENIWKKIGKAAAITGGVIAGVALIPISIGFGTAGIVGGSIAAAIQAGIGNVVEGYSICSLYISWNDWSFCFFCSSWSYFGNW